MYAADVDAAQIKSRRAGKLGEVPVGRITLLVKKSYVEKCKLRKRSVETGKADKRGIRGI